MSLQNAGFIRRWLALAPLACLVVGCGAPPDDSTTEDGGEGPDLPPLVAESEHFRLYAEEGPATALCGGTLGLMDAYVDALALKLEGGLQAGKKIDYYWLPGDGQMDRSPCTAAACTVGRKVYSPVLAHEHEITHAVINHWEPPESFFKEGLAEVMSSGGLPFSGDPDLSVAVEMLGVDRTRELGVETVTYVARHLIDEFGIDLLRQLSDELPDGPTRAEVLATFESVYGRSFDSVMQDIEPGQCRYRLLGCAADVVEWGGDEWSMDVELHCERPDATGPGDVELGADLEFAGGDVARIIGIDVSEAGNFATTRSTGFSPRLYACDFCQDELSIPGNDVQIELAKGRYYLRATANIDTPGPYSVGLTRIE